MVSCWTIWCHPSNIIAQNMLTFHAMSVTFGRFSKHLRGRMVSISFEDFRRFHEIGAWYWTEIWICGTDNILWQQACLSLSQAFSEAAARPCWHTLVIQCSWQAWPSLQFSLHCRLKSPRTHSTLNTIFCCKEAYKFFLLCCLRGGRSESFHSIAEQQKCSCG